MNQILVTDKLYITPELKRKKKIYKFNFLISLFLIIALCSFYVYAEYDRRKSEDVSQDILESMYKEDNTTISRDDDVWIIALDGSDTPDAYDASVSQENSNNSSVKENNQSNQSTQVSLSNSYKAPNGKVYNTVGTVNIPSINVNYPILTETSDELLKISVCKFWGANPNEVGNLCIAGHNYRNTRFFSKVPTLKVGDTIEITDLKGKTKKYSVFDKYTVDPTDVSCTSQLTNGKTIVTLITCTNDSKQRVVVKAKAM